jgi:superoxide dismutase, Cu-Zn family
MGTVPPGAGSYYRPFSPTPGGPTMPRTAALLASALLALAGGSARADVTVTMNAAGPGGVGDTLGTVTLRETPKGVLIQPALEGIEPGVHGFHLHQNPDCAVAEVDGKPTPAGAAGGHYDPQETGTHRGPYDDSGHRGDLPALYAEPTGAVRLPVLAPHVALSDFAGRALMVHAGGDTYADEPKLGGGGARIACGVVPK